MLLYEIDNENVQGSTGKTSATEERERFNELLEGGIQTPDEKRMFVELKATIEELESIIDIADTLLEHQADDK